MSVTPLLTMPYVTNWQPKVVTPSTDPELTKIGEPHCSSHSESVFFAFCYKFVACALLKM